MSRAIFDAADDAPVLSRHRRNGKRNIEQFAVLAPAYRLVMINPFAAREPRQDSRLLVDTLRRHQDRHRLARPLLRPCNRKMRSAPRFQVWMMPSRFLLMMASSEVSTIVASRRCLLPRGAVRGQNPVAGRWCRPRPRCAENVRRIVICHELSDDLSPGKNRNERQRGDPLGSHHRLQLFRQVAGRLQCPRCISDWRLCPPASKANGRRQLCDIRPRDRAKPQTASTLRSSNSRIDAGRSAGSRTNCIETGFVDFRRGLGAEKLVGEGV